MLRVYFYYTMLWELYTIVTYARCVCLICWMFCTGPGNLSVSDIKMKIHTLSCRFCSYCCLHIFKLQLVPQNFISLLWCTFYYCYILICDSKLSILVAPHDWHVFIYLLLNEMYLFLLHCINISGINVLESSNQYSLNCSSTRNSLCPNQLSYS